MKGDQNVTKSANNYELSAHNPNKYLELIPRKKTTKRLKRNS